MRKGQYVFLGIQLSILVLIVIIVCIDALKTQIIDARSANNLDCNNSSISTGQQGACIITDWYLFAWVGTGLGVSIGLLGIKKYVDQQQ